MAIDVAGLRGVFRPGRDRGAAAPGGGAKNAGAAGANPANPANVRWMCRRGLWQGICAPDDWPEL